MKYKAADINGLVAEKILGWTWVRFDNCKHRYRTGAGELEEWAWNPVESIADAWRVVNKLRDHYDVVVGQDKDGMSFCRLYTNREKDYCERQVMRASSPSLAICLAGLKSVGVLGESLALHDGTTSDSTQSPACPDDSAPSVRGESEGPGSC